MNSSPTWRKSTRSTGGTSGECVELASLRGKIGIRDSKTPHTPHLTVGRQALATLLVQIKSGALDL
ncbi:DUF397 domain-containing protein [Actinomadura terrae]|uniref:DUF397 domain-containing protein n=1 Tax=Actinomadura terrae TaxID=604353 RepID=UPI001FA7BC41|nr:DUF397 domain-containing protein [Actinomadura terrae]